MRHLIHSRRSRTPVRTVGVVCVLALAGLGAAPSPNPTPAAPQIRWGACPLPAEDVPAGMQCGTIEVPLDHANPAEGKVAVDLARIRAVGPGKRLGSLLLNYGGPGASGIEDLAADPKALADLGERYDLVAFDPRGVGHSDPVTCQGESPVAAELVTTGEIDVAELLAEIRAQAQRCAKDSGPVLPYMGTVHVARDMDVLRQALGEPKLNYLGFSYGSRLGAVYAALFPQRTGRMVLDGVDNLTGSLAERALATARARQRALGSFLTWCAQRKGCVYGTDAHAADERVAALIERLDRKPLAGDDGEELNGVTASTAISQGLFARALWPDLADALAMAERDGNPAGLLRILDPYAAPESQEQEEEDPDPIPADNFGASIMAVNCADEPDRSLDEGSPAAAEKEVARLEGEFREASKVFGPHLLGLALICYGRPAGTDFIRKIDHPGAPPMLLVGTRGDPATPYEWTEQTAERLGSGVVLAYEGEGHTGYLFSACVRGYVNRFLLDGQLPTGAQSCPPEG
ncbi:alpha/beta hydrolase [Streptomyces sp. NPDC060048]|uniref:alpha/beta hydrolase n=1 Tax=unclassified Streptomyces TaxID=2593676 RepID=UPI0036C974A6